MTYGTLTFRAPNNKIIQITSDERAVFDKILKDRVLVSRRVSKSANQTSVNETGCHQPCRGSSYNLIEVARWLMSNVSAFRSRLFKPFTRAIKRTRISKVFKQRARLSCFTFYWRHTCRSISSTLRYGCVRDTDKIFVMQIKILRS